MYVLDLRWWRLILATALCLTCARSITASDDPALTKEQITVKFGRATRLPHCSLRVSRVGRTILIMKNATRACLGLLPWPPW